MRDDEAGGGLRQALLVRAGTLTCALPIAHVVETMRPQSIRPLPKMPDTVLGAATIRGEAVPVLAMARLFGMDDDTIGRFVTVRAGGRIVALAVAEVIGMRPLASLVTAKLPALLSRAAATSIDTIGALDGELLVVLEAGSIVPADVAVELEALS